MKLTYPVLFATLLPAVSHAGEVPRFFPAASKTAESMANGTSNLPRDRRSQLDQVAEYVAARVSSGATAKLMFICTHNSRRSHIAQVWAQAAAAYYGLERVETFSGGTEATACNLRTIRALRRGGLEIVRATDNSNPIYLVQYAENRSPLRLYSKVYSAAPNPKHNYAAILCCSDADEKCPEVSGAEVRIPLHYLDPKLSDDTAQENATYDERSLEIGTEMFYALAKAAQLLERK